MACNARLAYPISLDLAAPSTHGRVPPIIAARMGRGGDLGRSPHMTSTPSPPEERDNSAPRNDINLPDLFGGLQDQMAATLKLQRAVTPHAPTKGTGTEVHWLDWLNTYLPKRYCVQHNASLLDSTGAHSDCIDLVICDRQYTPFLFKQNEITYIPAEAVYAVFESKQEISRGDVEYAALKAASVRKLHRTSIAITHAGGTFPPRTPYPILAGLLAVADSYKHDHTERHLTDILASVDPTARLDLVLSIDGYAADITYTDQPAVSSAVGSTALIYFYLTLLRRLQALGTAPAIDFVAYLSQISSTKKGGDPQ